MLERKLTLLEWAYIGPTLDRQKTKKSPRIGFLTEIGKVTKFRGFQSLFYSHVADLWLPRTGSPLELFCRLNHLKATGSNVFT